MLVLFVVILQRGFFDEFAFVINRGKDIRSRFVVDGVGGAGVDIERDAELFERILDHTVVAVDHLLRGDAFLAGFQGDGHAVLIRAPDEKDLFAFGAEVADVDIGRHIDPGQVADVNGAVGIGQGGGDGGAFPGF